MLPIDWRAGQCYIVAMATVKMQTCRFCGDPVEASQMFKHEWSAHRPERLIELEEARKKAHVIKYEGSEASGKKNGHKTSPGSSSGSASSAETKAAVKTADIGEAVSVTIAPKRFEMESTLLWQAMQAAIREWDWPTDITPADFLDTYLFESFKQRGVILGAYQVVDRKRGGNGNDN